MQDKFLIQGGTPLRGEVEVAGYKNSAGAVLAAALLSKEPSIIDNLPKVKDVLDQIEILKQLGAEVEWLTDKKAKINTANINPATMPTNLFERMRVSVLLIGPLLARCKKIKVPHPGGDKIGLRPISTHLQALKDYGVNVEEREGFYYLQTPENLQGKRVVLREFSVTATEILMMLAARTPGKTIIETAAAEPQVQDLGMFLRKMGVDVEGVGTHTITIHGRENLMGADFEICPDLLEAGTFFLAFALTKGEGIIKKVNPQHLTMFLEKMKEIGINFQATENEIRVMPSGDLRNTRIQVLPYPGFPTDLQPQTSVLLTQIPGKNLVHEPLYENRFQYLQELRKMGADIEITDPHRALIFGKTELKGNHLNALDIRSGAALILAGLTAQGKSLIENISHIERGHEKIDEKLRSLGAKIEKI